MSLFYLSILYTLKIESDYYKYLHENLIHMEDKCMQHKAL